MSQQQYGKYSGGLYDNEDDIHCTQHTVIGSTHLLLDLINWVSKWLDGNQLERA